MRGNGVEKKMIIIGGGVSGLVAGIYACRAGFRAEIYERHTTAGGECTGWNRQGYHIDNCIHWMMGTFPGSDLYRLWEDVGAVGDGIRIHRPDRMYTSQLGGQRVTLWQDIDRTEEELIRLSPEDTVEIKKLMKSCRAARKVQIPAKLPPEQIGALEGTKMLFTMGAALKLFKEYKGMDTADLMNRFSDPVHDFGFLYTGVAGLQFSHGLREFCGRRRGNSRRRILCHGAADAQYLRNAGGQDFYRKGGGAHSS